MELSYITESVLRQRIDDSIEYIYTLYEQSKREENGEIYQSETYRVIIVYIVAIIEAVLFYVYQRHPNKITKIEYKDKINFKESYQNSNIKGRVILATEKIIEKGESELSLHELVTFLEKEKVLKSDTVAKLKNIMTLRNSVHLRQKQSAVCTVGDVEDALDFLVYVITHTSKRIKRQIGASNH